MKRLFSFALGNIWRWNTSKNRNDLINVVKMLDVSGVEITLTTEEELYAFEISNDNKQWLKNLDYVTIHAPFNLWEDPEDDVIQQIKCISKIYHSIHAQNVIIHPLSTCRGSEILKNKEFNVSIENLPPKNGVSTSELQNLMDNHPHLKFCLDVSHAFLWSKLETGILVKNFEERISQIHFSGVYKRKDHQSLRKVSDDFLRSIQPIRNLELPIVIEEDIKTKSIEYVKEEIEYIKKLLNSDE